MKENLPLPTDMGECILITHQNCTDGAGCAVLFLEAGGKKENIRYIPAGQVERFLKKDPVVGSGRFLMFADLGLTSSKQAEGLEKRGECVIIDHHKTSEHLSDRPWCWIEMGACGTELLRQYLKNTLTKVWTKNLKNPEIPASFDHRHSNWQYFASLIDDRDRWQNKMLPISEQLVDLMDVMGQEEFVYKMRDWSGRCGTAYGPFTGNELFALKYLEKKRKENINNLLKNVIIIDQPWGKTGYVITGEYNISALLHEMLIRNPELKVSAQINLDKRMVSLRSLEGMDVSEVAKLFGGGGHAQAAGHPLPPNLFRQIIDEVH